MKSLKCLYVSVLSLVLILSGCSKNTSDKLEASDPVTISVWHYYNGDQLESFNRLVKNFNDTVGKEKGVIVQASSQGSVSDLESNVLDAIEGKVGAAKVPNIFSAYADTVYKVNELDYVANINEYFTDEELDEYIDGYIEEGYFGDELKIFPIAKSTEVFMMNKTDWEKFAGATGADIQSLNTIEGITAIAKQYYEWTDSLTSEENDGKAFFGRDAVANLFFVGFKQHGKEIFNIENDIVTLDFDKEIVRKIWDNYYIPYIKGYFSSAGRFRSDDIKTGNIISFVGSSSGATFFPSEVIVNDDDSYMIENSVMEAPIFANQNKVAVQQGAGMVVTKASKKEELASIEFLKWFTQLDQNIDFSISSGYLPVKNKANNIEEIEAHVLSDSVEIDNVIHIAINTVNTSLMYTPKAFEKGTEARSILEYSLSDKAKEDRQTILDLIANGLSYEDAIAKFDNDANFEKWYEDTTKKLETLIK